MLKFVIFLISNFLLGNSSFPHSSTESSRFQSLYCSREILRLELHAQEVVSGLITAGHTVVRAKIQAIRSSKEEITPLIIESQIIESLISNGAIEYAIANELYNSGVLSKKQFDHFFNSAKPASVRRGFTLAERVVLKLISNFDRVAIDFKNSYLTPSQINDLRSLTLEDYLALHDWITWNLLEKPPSFVKDVRRAFVWSHGLWHFFTIKFFLNRFHFDLRHGLIAAQGPLEKPALNEYDLLDSEPDNILLDLGTSTHIQRQFILARYINEVSFAKLKQLQKSLHFGGAPELSALIENRIEYLGKLKSQAEFKEEFISINAQQGRPEDLASNQNLEFEIEKLKVETTKLQDSRNLLEREIHLLKRLLDDDGTFKDFPNFEQVRLLLHEFGEGEVELYGIHAFLTMEKLRRIFSPHGSALKPTEFQHAIPIAFRKLSLGFSKLFRNPPSEIDSPINQKTFEKVFEIFREHAMRVPMNRMQLGKTRKVFKQSISQDLAPTHENTTYFEIAQVAAQNILDLPWEFKEKLELDYKLTAVRKQNIEAELEVLQTKLAEFDHQIKVKKDLEESLLKTHEKILSLKESYK